MKKNMILSGAFVAMLCLFGISNVNAQDDLKEIKEFCPSHEYPDWPKSDALHGRGVGDATTIAAARDKADLAARADLAKKIQSYVYTRLQEISDDLSTEVGGEVSSEVNKITRVIAERVSGMTTTVCEKSATYHNEEGGQLIYRTHKIYEIDVRSLNRETKAQIRQSRILSARCRLKDFDKNF